MSAEGLQDFDFLGQGSLWQSTTKAILAYWISSILQHIEWDPHTCLHSELVHCIQPICSETISPGRDSEMSI